MINNWTGGLKKRLSCARWEGWLTVVNPASLAIFLHRLLTSWNALFFFHFAFLGCSRRLLGLTESDKLQRKATSQGKCLRAVFKGHLPASDWCCRELLAEWNRILDVVCVGWTPLWIRWQVCPLVWFKEMPCLICRCQNTCKAPFEAYLFIQGFTFGFKVYILPKPIL